jgi:hypothetical protein
MQIRGLSLMIVFELRNTMFKVCNKCYSFDLSDLLYQVEC